NSLSSCLTRQPADTRRSSPARQRRSDWAKRRLYPASVAIHVSHLSLGRGRGCATRPLERRKTRQPLSKSGQSDSDKDKHEYETGDRHVSFILKRIPRKRRDSGPKANGRALETTTAKRSSILLYISPSRTTRIVTGNRCQPAACRQEFFRLK